MDISIIAIACFSLVVTGSFDDLDTVAKALMADQPYLSISLVEYPVGWRLTITNDNNLYPHDAYDLVQEQIDKGLAIQIANGKQAMATYIYHKEH